MRWASFVSQEPEMEAAVREAALELSVQLGGADPDLVLVFVSSHYSDTYETLPEALQSYFPNAALAGCSAGGVVGGGREVEQAPALSLTAAVLPDVNVAAFHVGQDDTEALVEHPEVWQEVLELDETQPVHFVLLPEPFTCDARALVASLDAAFPASGKVGGLASGAEKAGDNALFIGDEVRRDGAVGVVLNGALEMDTLVAQGCRPVGAPMFVTRAFRNRVLELDGRPPMEILADLYDTLDAAERRLFRQALFVGLVMTPGREEYGPGDFLVRNIIGLDSDTGVMAIGEIVEPGQVLQFHLRDAGSSAADLTGLLQDFKSGGADAPAGALLFSCLGRGEMLYGQPDHDSRLIAEHLGPMPIGGFFCNGEIGPVNRQTFLHGYTSSIAFFSSPKGPRESA